MVPDIPPVDITQNERFLSCDNVLLGVRYVDGKICQMRLSKALLGGIGHV
jgi:hypothetical protein